MVDQKVRELIKAMADVRMPRDEMVSHLQEINVQNPEQAIDEVLGKAGPAAAQAAVPAEEKAEEKAPTQVVIKAPAATPAAAPVVAPVEVPAAATTREAKSPKVKTGIPGLDDLMQGGFEPRSVVLLSGDPGSGKTTLALQFLYAGAMQYDEPGVFITFEERKEDIFRHMEGYGWKLEDLVNKHKLAILEYPPHEIERFITEGEIIRDIIMDIGAKRLVIDSMSSFAMLFDSPYKLRQGILKILSTLKKWGCTILVTSEGARGEKGEVADRFGLEYLTDGFVYLYNVREGDRRNRLLEIIELKGTSHDTNIHEVAFSKKGVGVSREPWSPRKEVKPVTMSGWE